MRDGFQGEMDSKERWIPRREGLVDWRVVGEQV